MVELSHQPPKYPTHAPLQPLGLAEQVCLAGPRAHAELIRIFREAAFFVAPCVISSDGDRDGLPTVFVEAMVLGTPVISTQVVGIPELVRHNDTGLCVAERDPAALADAMARLLQDANLRSSLRPGPGFDMNLRRCRCVFPAQNRGRARGWGLPRRDR